MAVELAIGLERSDETSPLSHDTAVLSLLVSLVVEDLARRWDQVCSNPYQKTFIVERQLTV